MLEVGSVVARFKADLANLKKGIGQAKKAISGLGGGFAKLGGIANKALISIKNGFSKAIKQARLLGVAVGAGVVAIGKSALDSASKFEQANIAYKTLLGSAKKAREAIKAVEEDAKKTPFNLTDLIKYNQLLISAGENTEKARQVIIDLGNAVSATGGGTAEMNRLAANLQQIKAVGKASALDVKQFAYAGINIYKLLADTTGKTVEQVKEMPITYDMLTEALHKASQAGGMFEGAMEAQSKSLQGVISNIQDIIEIGFKNILVDSGAFDAIKGMLEGFMNWLGDAIPKITRFFTVLGNAFAYLGDVIKGQFDIGEIREMLSYFTGGEMPSEDSPIVRFFIKFGEVLGWLGDFVDEHKDTILTFLQGLAIAFGALTIAGTIAGLIALLTNPITLVAGAIALLYTAWQTNFLGIRDITMEVINWIIEAVNWLVQAWQTDWLGIQTIVTTAIQVITFLFNTFVAFFRLTFENMKQIATGAFQILKGLFQITFGHFLLVILFFIAVFTGKWKKAFNLAKQIVQNMYNGVTNIFRGLLNVIRGVMGGLYNVVVGTLESIYNKVKEIVSKIVNKMKEISPFTKHSPSLVELVEKGTRKMADSYAWLADAINGEQLHASVQGMISNFSLSPAVSSPAGATPVVVNQTITAQLQDRLDVDTLAERLAFKARNEVL